MLPTPRILPSASATAPCWPCPSSVDVLLRNLHLLHLDQRPDWPGLTTQSFAPSPQNQRARIKAVEWTLYHLLLIWDPEETRVKLAPIFPPADQLQSTSLRAALLKTLTDLKKNGGVSRNAILRKSTFDECKGDNFEDLLATFSTTVLRAWLDRNRGAADDDPILAIARGCDATHDERTVPLILSLSSAIQARSKSGNQGGSLDCAYRRAAKTLDEQEARIDASLNDSAAPKSLSMSVDDPLFRQTRHLFAESWEGEQSWAEFVLEGGAEEAHYRLFQLGFDEAWRLLRQGADINDLPSYSDPDDGPDDVLTALGQRLAAQRSRLKRWKAFREVLSSEKSRSSGTVYRPRNQTTRHVFGRHQDLNAAGLAKNLKPYDASQLKPNKAEHATVLEALDTALLAMKRDAGQRSRHAISRRNSRRSNHDDRLWAPSSQSSRRGSASIQTHSPAALSPRKEATTAKADLTTSIIIADYEGVQSTNIQTDLGSAAPKGDDNVEVSEALSEVRVNLPPSSPDSDAPGPRLSLTERTRQSMRASIPFPSPSSRSTSPRPSASPEPHEATAGAHHALLTPDAYHTPRRLTSPPSPARRFRDGDAATRRLSGSSTPREELFDYEADYARVFKSRPKIALSPVRTPPTLFHERNRRIGDLTGEESEGGDEPPAVANLPVFGSSPLARRGTG